MSKLTAAASGQFTIERDIIVNRLGFGAMRVTGDGIWGEPSDRQAAIRTLQRVPELGINLVDTADSYGPFVSETLIRETLYPYRGLTIATKGGLTRLGPNIWKPVGRPEYLRQCVLMSLRRLGLERIDLWQLHRLDPHLPREEQFGAIAEMRKDGLIRHVGLCNVSVEDVEAAQAYFPVASVQNRYNLTDRTSEDVLTHCEREKIGFIPWAPLSAGTLARPGSLFTTMADRLHLSPGQLALAWVLKRSPVMLPIPGTANPDHLEQNVEAAGVDLSDDDFQTLDKQGREEWDRRENLD